MNWMDWNIEIMKNIEIVKCTNIIVKYTKIIANYIIIINLKKYCETPKIVKNNISWTYVAYNILFNFPHAF